MRCQRLAVADVLSGIGESIEESDDVFAIEEKLVFLKNGCGSFAAFLGTLALGDGEIVFVFAVLLDINIVHAASGLDGLAVEHGLGDPCAVCLFVLHSVLMWKIGKVAVGP